MAGIQDPMLTAANLTDVGRKNLMVFDESYKLNLLKPCIICRPQFQLIKMNCLPLPEPRSRFDCSQACGISQLVASKQVEGCGFELRLND